MIKSLGNIEHYIECNIKGTVDIGDVVEIKKCDKNYSAQLLKTEKWLWNNAIDGKLSFSSNSIDSDKDGNIYIFLTCEQNGEPAQFFNANNLTVNNKAFVYSSSNDVDMKVQGIVAKCDKNGKWLWTAGITNNISTGAVQSIKTDNYGNSYIVFLNVGKKPPKFYSSLKNTTSPFIDMKGRNKTVLPNSEDTNSVQVVVAKIDSCGNWIWNASIDSLGSFSFPSISISDFGDIVVSTNVIGSNKPNFYDALNNGVNEIPSLCGREGVCIDIYPNSPCQTIIAKISKLGKWKWNASIDCLNEFSTENLSSIAVDKCGNTVIAGVIDILNFPSLGIINLNVEPPKFYDADGNTVKLVPSLCGRLGKGDTGSFLPKQIYVAKISSKGKWVWNASIDGENNNNFPNVVIDNCNNAYISSIYTVLSNSIDNIPKFYNAKCDTVDNIPALFGKNTLGLSSSSKHQYSIAKINKNGIWLWNASIDSPNLNFGFLSLDIDKYNNCFVAGNIGDLPQFFNSDNNVGVETQPFLLGKSNDTSQMFIGKINSYGKWLWNASVSSLNDIFNSKIIVDENGYVNVCGLIKGFFCDEILFYNPKNKTVDNVYSIKGKKLIPEEIEEINSLGYCSLYIGKMTNEGYCEKKTGIIEYLNKFKNKAIVKIIKKCSNQKC